jgi:hypothetical protein
MCTDEETYHFDEKISYVLLSLTSYTTEQCQSSGEISESFTFPPTQIPTDAPSKAEHHSNAPTTLSYSNESSKNGSNSNNNLLLAILLPICIVILIAMIGFGAKSYFKSYGKLDDESAHSLRWGTPESGL